VLRTENSSVFLKASCSVEQVFFSYELDLRCFLVDWKYLFPPKKVWTNPKSLEFLLFENVSCLYFVKKIVVGYITSDLSCRSTDIKQIRSVS